MSYYFRYATENDVKLIFDWANEKEVRKNSFCTEEIKYDEHVKWYSNLLADREKNCQLIFMSDDLPLGQCRLRIEGVSAEIGYSIDSSHRGQGIGSLMLKELNTWLRENRPEIKTIVAKVKTENEASIKAFEKNGYKDIYTELRYEL